MHVHVCTYMMTAVVDCGRQHARRLDTRQKQLSLCDVSQLILGAKKRNG